MGRGWPPGVAWMARGGGRGRGRHRGGYPGEFEGGPGFPPFPPFPPGGLFPGRPGWPPFGGPGGGFGPFRRGRRVRRGDVRAAALSLLAEGPRNGYQIIQEINARSRGVWRPSPGSVYPALQQLEDEGLVRVDEAGGAGRVFHLTEQGRAYVEANREELAEPWAAVADSVGDDQLLMREIFGGLFAAAMQVTHAGTAAQIAEARKILEGARRRLYGILAEGAPIEDDTDADDDDDDDAAEGGPEVWNA
jgi:DNA-binding PadR family transcriptional regulator